MSRSVLAFLIAVALPATSIAAPRVLSQRQLTEGALLGQIASTAQLQREFLANAPLLATASRRLGLTKADFDAVRRAVGTRHARYVLIPRHLDGTSGQVGGVPFIDRDIIIPANVYGWEVDIAKPEEIVRVFVLTPCGNISYLRVPKPFRVAAAHIVPPVPTPEPTATPEPVAEVVPTPEPLITSAPVIASSTHHLGWLPLLAIPLIFAFAGHGSSNSSPHHIIVPPPINTPCPTAIVIRR